MSASSLLRLPCGQEGTHPSLPMPTFGGLQFWRDTRVNAGWRIQQNIRTGAARLLDPANRQQCRGDENSCLARLDALKASRGIEPASDHTVLLLHGIARSTGTFRKLEDALRNQGYDATAISYPSTRTDIETHADGLETLLSRLDRTKTVSFVTHSMGALVLRHTLSRKADWMERITVGRIVMIAPPNQGAAVAGFLKNISLYRWLYGPSGQQLVPGTVADMPGLEGREVAVIAGGRGNGKGFNPFLPGDDDGTVTVAETELDGVRDRIVISSTHNGISNHPDTVNATTTFLRSGGLRVSSTATGEKNA
ncbi:MAG: alpha/beta fold hydrolase [Alphaproteobacteria bacterium]|nr:alpha/beta fold hydrolase [Alphaproteobacteria bacterium]